MEMHYLAPLALFVALIAIMGNDQPPKQNISAEEAPGVTRLVLEPLGNELRFSASEIKVKAGAELKIEFVNLSTLMPHSILFLISEDYIETVGTAAMKAMKTDFVPPEHRDVILAATRVAQPGESVTVAFKAPPPGTYPFICPYPGHYSYMQGVLVVEE